MPSIKQWIQTLGRERPWGECPFWPPDVYAIAGALLKRSGAYLHVFKHSDPPQYLRGIAKQGNAWQVELNRVPDDSVATLRQICSSEIQKSWRILTDVAATCSLSEISERPGLCEHLLRLALIADQASAGIGVDWPSDLKRHRFLSIADGLKSENDLRSFCWDVPPDVLCVLGKQHTPQRGATFRSLSHHLALYQPNEIEARWHGPYCPPDKSFEKHRMLNLLLLPWPTQVDSRDFARVPPKNAKRKSIADNFEFRPEVRETSNQFRARLKRAIGAARRQAAKIDAVVLPELALTKRQFDVAEGVAIDEGMILISGVRIPDTPRDNNWVMMQPAGVLDSTATGFRKTSFADQVRFSQAKHHRWCLDRDQIVNYQLGGQLTPSRLAWENIDLPRRVLYFANINQLTWSVLICEDLARQDPAADVIRAVGPNLVIALLMDGPQLRGRWPSRYASVLADDPGTSVLTLTNLGMAERSRPVDPGTGKRSEARRVIALWRDVETGDFEVALDPKEDACVLSLECVPRTEYSADGREHPDKPTPVYAGFKAFQIGS
jgi:hypothetical protein